jgi:hypothetical protein
MVAEHLASNARIVLQGLLPKLEVVIVMDLRPKKGLNKKQTNWI